MTSGVSRRVVGGSCGARGWRRRRSRNWRHSGVNPNDGALRRQLHLQPRPAVASVHAATPLACPCRQWKWTDDRQRIFSLSSRASWKTGHMTETLLQTIKTKVEYRRDPASYAVTPLLLDLQPFSLVDFVVRRD